MLKTFAVDFKYIAPFRNQSGLGAKLRPNFALFLIKVRGDMGKLSHYIEQLSALAMHVLAFRFEIRAK